MGPASQRRQRRHYRQMARSAVLVGCATLVSCLGYVPQPPRPTLPEPMARDGVEVLSAQHSAVALEREGGAGRIILVFSERIDPTSLEASDFLINLEDGRWLYPERALLDPASGFGRNRSVSLVGTFDRRPVAVNVLGGVYTQAGDPVGEISTEVAAVGEPDRIVFAEWLDADDPDDRDDPDGAADACPNIIRTHWSDVLSEISVDEVAEVTLSLREGPPSRPRGLAGAGARDNVLDLCVDAVPVTQISVPVGLGADHLGQSTAAGTAPVERPS